MSEVKETITQEVENNETTEEKTSATPSTETLEAQVEVEETKTTTEEDVETNEEPVVEAEPEVVIEKATPMVDYLGADILNIRTVTPDELGSFDEEDRIEIEDARYDESFSEIRQREVVKGVVVGITDREVFVDIGFKAEGTIDKSEFSEVPEEGQEVDVFIVTFEDRKGNIVLSKERADFQKRWQELKEIHANDEIITGLITKRIKGGMVVDLGVVQAFLPGSQIDVRPVVDFDEFVGVESEFKVVKLNELRQNIVLSRKAILAGDLLEKRQEVLSQMEVGMELEGVVKNLTDFGAFVDLGGIDGLLHITDITWGRINHPSEKLTVGETVHVKVIDFDVEKVRVSLGIKQLTPDPWEEVIKEFPVESEVSGKIVNMMNYGAFVEIREGVEGLIHVSEMSWTRHVKHPTDMFKIGDEVNAKVLSIDPDDKKISLGIKQLEENPWDTIETKYAIGSDHKGIVRNLTQFGAFIELETGIDGLVHVSDMSWTKMVKHPKEIVKKGDNVDVKVLSVSSEERRLSLGIKQVQDDPWPTLKNEFETGKVITGEVIRVLDKGIIFQLEHEVEGIVPLKKVTKAERTEIKEKYIPGEKCEIIVQEVDEEYKKVILMRENKGEDAPKSKPSKPKVKKPKMSNVSTSDKLEVPQEIIDQLAATDKDNSED